MKVAPLSEDNPSEAGELVGECHGGFVVSTLLLEFEGPAAEPIELFLALGGPEYGSGTVDKESSQVGVSTFGDSSEPTYVATGILPGCEAEEARKVPSGWEPLYVPDEGDESGRGQKTDTVHTAQVRDGRDLPAQSVELALTRPDLLFEVADLVARRQQARPEALGRTGVGVVEQSADV